MERRSVDIWTLTETKTETTRNGFNDFERVSSTMEIGFRWASLEHGRRMTSTTDGWTTLLDGRKWTTMLNGR
uniref:Uncharacterized protein n=1 Tax=Cucumis melo TaxID=3656 RepID=A0A9I9D4Z9_CUCME